MQLISRTETLVSTSLSQHIVDSQQLWCLLRDKSSHFPVWEPGFWLVTLKWEQWNLNLSVIVQHQLLIAGEHQHNLWLKSPGWFSQRGDLLQSLVCQLSPASRASLHQHFHSQTLSLQRLKETGSVFSQAGKYNVLWSQFFNLLQGNSASQLTGNAAVRRWSSLFSHSQKYVVAFHLPPPLFFLMENNH